MLIPQELQLSLESTQKNERKAQRKNINAMTSNIHCFFPHYNK